MMKKIGIENFLVFNEMTEMELAPITVLTGPNNSGKSSFTKFLRFMAKGIDNFSFRVPELNLNSIREIKNWENNADEIKIRVGGEIPFLVEDIVIELTYRIRKEESSKKLDSLTVLANNEILFSAQRRITVDLNNSFAEEEYSINNFNIDFIVERLVGNGLGLNRNYMTKGQMNHLTGVTMREFFEKRIAEITEKFGGGSKRLLKVLNDENNKISDEELAKIEKVLFDSRAISEPYEVVTLPYSNYLLSLLRKFKDFPSQKDSILRKNGFNFSADLELEFTDLGNFIFKEEYVPELISLVHQLYENFSHVEFISLNRGTHQNYLRHNGVFAEVEMESVISEIINEGLAEDNNFKSFLKDSFNLLGLNYELNIINSEGVVNFVKMTSEDRDQNISNMGYGFSQLVPILLKIAITGLKANRLRDFWNPSETNFRLIIEEPESNLHPNLQSKLADVFLMAIKTFDIELILETHSEYLIRRFQYLVAKKELKRKEIVIHYFSTMNTIQDHNETRVKSIKINEFGGLTDSFGSGFFDEATRLKFELLQLNKERLN
ncbi:MAG: AAA family ATPase [Flavobacteriales bacterium]|nr:AAA family ATPase [Flavobacteriales bacterium]